MALTRLTCYLPRKTLPLGALSGAAETCTVGKLGKDVIYFILVMVGTVTK